VRRAAASASVVILERLEGKVKNNDSGSGDIGDLCCGDEWGQWAVHERLRRALVDVLRININF
jgi:hypothetical protein